ICLVVSNQTAKKRNQEIFDFATERGFLFNPGPCEVHIPLSGFLPFDQGREQRSTNHLFAKQDEIEWDIFDYKYVTGYGKHNVTHPWEFCAARVDFLLPLMILRPPRFTDKIAELVGLDTATFQDLQFDTKYKVQCKDYQACRELLHAKMIQHLCAAESRH